MAATPDQATATALQALHSLYHDPDSSSKRRANEWLEEFQHSTEAWTTCHTLLTAPDTPLEGRLFSAQTIRAKILYDLSQLPRSSLISLRDSILSSVTPLTQPGAPVGSRAVVTQLCLALADLALQMPEWENVVQGMIDRFGQDPSTVVVLLKFLGSLAEETLNTRLPVTDAFNKLVGESADAVLNILSIYIQATGITPQIQISIFDTLRSWLRSGELSVGSVAQSPLFNAMFAALSSDELFDSAVDLICDLIHETQEVDDTIEVIQQILPRLIALRPELEVHNDDPDRIRGYCRMFCEAGECNMDVIRRHPTDTLPLVEAIMACTTYPDLEIVPITFQFWWALASILSRQKQEGADSNPEWAPYIALFQTLQTTIIHHLHFPPDNETQTPQERDEFRSFRHRMGDTLKDCCQVLGASTCLRRSYDLVVAAISKPSPSWQEIEAPLFSMRSMGAEVDPDDDEVMPHIMEMLPKLPEHPRIRYAAILVISRYTQWIDRHPQNLEFQLQYVSEGFNMADDDVSAAAAQAMKFMCQDCNSHLVPYLPQLYAFVSTVGERLDQNDMVEVCEAIGYVISCQQPEAAAQSLRQFCEPLITKVQQVASMSNAAKTELQKAADALEQIDSYLRVIRTLNPVPESCFASCVSVYAVLDALLARYASLYYISERVGSVLRRGLAFFPERALEPVVQPVLARMASAFEETGYASNIWITGKVASKFGETAARPGGEALGALLVGAFESITASLARLLSTKEAVSIPDVMDDYAHCFLAYLSSNLPIIASSSLPIAFGHILAALLCPAPEVILVSLDVLALLSQRLDHAQFQPFLQPIFAQYAKPLLALVLAGVVQGYPEDSLGSVKDVVSATVLTVSPAEAEAYVSEALSSIPGHVIPAADRQAFLEEVHEHLLNPGGGSDGMKQGVFGLVRAARRARERGRQSRKSLGAGMD